MKKVLKLIAIGLLSIQTLSGTLRAKSHKKPHRIAKDLDKALQLIVKNLGEDQAALLAWQALIIGSTETLAKEPVKKCLFLFKAMQQWGEARVYLEKQHASTNAHSDYELKHFQQVEKESSYQAYEAYKKIAKQCFSHKETSNACKKVFKKYAPQELSDELDEGVKEALKKKS